MTAVNGKKFDCHIPAVGDELIQLQMKAKALNENEMEIQPLITEKSLNEALSPLKMRCFLLKEGNLICICWSMLFNTYFILHSTFISNLHKGIGLMQCARLAMYDSSILMLMVQLV